MPTTEVEAGVEAGRAPLVRGASLVRGVPELRPRWHADVGEYAVDARWSPDGACVAAACADGAVVLLDGATGQVRHRLDAHAGGTLALAWSAPEGTRPHGVLATAGQDGRVRLWDPAAGAPLADLDAAGVDAPNGHMPDGHMPNGSTPNGSTPDGSTPDGSTPNAAAPLRPARRMVPWAEQLAWSPDGRRLATGAGREVRVWDAEGRLLRRHPPLASTVGALAWRPRPGDAAGPRLSAACYGGVVLYAEPAPNDPAESALDDEGRGLVERWFPWKGSFLATAWSPDGRVLAAGMQESAIHLWVQLSARAVNARAAKGEAPVPAPRAAGLPPSVDEAGFDNLEMSGYPTKVRELAWHPDGRLLATGGGRQVIVWSFAGKGPAGTRPLQLEGHALLVSDVAFSRAGTLLASGGEDGQLLVWDLVRSSKKPVGGVLLTGAVSRLAWHPHERLVLGAHASGVVAAWEAPR